MSGFTLDTGALIALERRKQRMLYFVKHAETERKRMTVPSVVLAEFWRGQRGPIATLITDWHKENQLEPVTVEIAKIAGKSLGNVRPGPSVTDAIVMAWAPNSKVRSTVPASAVAIWPSTRMSPGWPSMRM